MERTPYKEPGEEPQSPRPSSHESVGSPRASSEDRKDLAGEESGGLRSCWHHGVGRGRDRCPLHMGMTNTPVDATGNWTHRPKLWPGQPARAGHEGRWACCSGAPSQPLGPAGSRCLRQGIADFLGKRYLPGCGHMRVDVACVCACTRVYVAHVCIAAPLPPYCPHSELTAANLPDPFINRGPCTGCRAGSTAGWASGPSGGCFSPSSSPRPCESPASPSDDPRVARRGTGHIPQIAAPGEPTLAFA